MTGNLVLIGFSGAGKSSVGRLVAKRLGWRFVDSDQEVVGRHGRPIEQIFGEEGETRFRTYEREVVAEVCAGVKQVISLGGGAIVDERNKQVVMNGNYVARLAAKPATILHRLEADRGVSERPLLTSPDPLQRITTLLAQREQHYQATDWQIDTEGLTPAEVAELVLAELKERMR